MAEAPCRVPSPHDPAWCQICADFSPRRLSVGLLLLAAAVIFTLSGCAPRMTCQVLGDLRTRRDIEVCGRRECRDVETGKFVACPPR